MVDVPWSPALKNDVETQGIAFRRSARTAGADRATLFSEFRVKANAACGREKRERNGIATAPEGSGRGEGREPPGKGWGRKKANYQRKDDVRPNEELGLVAGSRKR